ncbi:hypothetical protein D9M71_451710 [compost metagenome]
MAMEPMAVNIQDSSDTAPSWAMLVGSMMMPEPIMFTATRVVSPVRPIFLPGSAIDDVIPNRDLLGIDHSERITAKILARV